MMKKVGKLFKYWRFVSQDLGQWKHVSMIRSENSLSKTSEFVAISSKNIIIQVS